MYNKTQNRLIAVILACVAAAVKLRTLFGYKPEEWPEKTEDTQI